MAKRLTKAERRQQRIDAVFQPVAAAIDLLAQTPPESSLLPAIVANLNTVIISNVPDLAEAIAEQY